MTVSLLSAIFINYEFETYIKFIIVQNVLKYLYVTHEVIVYSFCYLSRNRKIFIANQTKQYISKCRFIMCLFHPLYIHRCRKIFVTFPLQSIHIYSSFSFHMNYRVINTILYMESCYNVNALFKTNTFLGNNIAYLLSLNDSRGFRLGQTNVKHFYILHLTHNHIYIKIEFEYNFAYICFAYSKFILKT